MQDMTFRPANRDESRVIARLYQISSDGVADYIWTRLAEPGEDLLDVGARRYARVDTDFSYQNVTVAVHGGEVVGMMAAYVMRPAEQKPSEFDFDVDPVLRPYDRLELPNSFYISGMALFERYRGRGLGTEFLKLAAGRARGSGLSKVSLIVFEDNVGAKRLYERVGFREVMREPVVPHPLIHFTGYALLMALDV